MSSKDEIKHLDVPSVYHPGGGGGGGGPPLKRMGGISGKFEIGASLRVFSKFPTRPLVLF